MGAIESLSLSSRAKKMRAPVILLLSCIIIACDNTQKPSLSQNLQETLIIGSAESPDPVLLKVEELEKSGIVKDVVIMESFPVQIHLKAPKYIIDELNEIPRVQGGLY